MAGPSELDRVLDESEAILDRVGAEVSGAWYAAYRGLGVVYFGVALTFGLLDLHIAPAAGTSGSTLYLVSYELELTPTAVFAVLGLTYYLDAGRFRARHERNRARRHQWGRREPVPDSRLAGMVDRVQGLRKEIGSLETMVDLSLVLLILFSLTFLPAAAVVALTGAQLGSGLGAGAGRLVVLAIIGGAGVLLALFVLFRAIGSFRTTRRLASGLIRCDRLLAALEYQFMGWG